MNRTSHRMAALLALAGAMGLIAWPANARWKDTPPKGVTLTGTAWRIDPYQSDDPNAVIEKAYEDEQARRMEERNRSRRGVLGGSDRPFDRGGATPGSGGPWGGEEGPIGTGRADLPGGGGWRHDEGRTSTEIDPTGTTQSASIHFGSRGGVVRNEFLLPLLKNPETLAFFGAGQRLKVSADRIETECTPGEKMPIADSYGDGERRCGWEGRTWVVETRRGNRFTRVDRYELSKDGKTLTYVTTATGANMPRVTISRTYTAAPPSARIVPHESASAVS